MIRGTQIRESLPLRVLASLLAALIINALLLALIHSLVSATRGTIADFEEIHMVDFVRLKPQPKAEDTPPDRPETAQEDKQEPPPEPLESLIQPLERQKPPVLRPARLDFDPRISLSGDPYLGEFEPAPSFNGLDAGEPSLQIPPVYPPRAKRMGIEGRVTVEFTITADGSVEDAKVVEANPPRVFDRAVLRAIRRWKFTPRVVNGRATERRARKQVVFKLERH